MDDNPDKPDADPTVTHIEVTALPEGPGDPVVDERRVTVHAHVLRHCLAAQRALLSLSSPARLFTYLTEDFPRAFAAPGVELKLHDPEGRFRDAMRSHGQHGLSFLRDSYPLYEAFGGDPRLVLLTLDDPRMFHMLAGARDAVGAAVLPLLDGGRLLGVYHLALAEGMLPLGEEDRSLLVALAQLISATLLRTAGQVGTERLQRVDPDTGLANPQALGLELDREIARARRQGQPLTVLQLQVDDLDDVLRSRGDVGAARILRQVAERVGLDLRGTDILARVAPAQFIALLTVCGEPQAYDIATRLARDLRQTSIDDGRGAVFAVTLSVGLVCWDPARHPVADDRRVARQLRESAEEALARVLRGGGDGIAVAHLGVLMI